MESSNRQIGSGRDCIAMNTLKTVRPFEKSSLLARGGVHDTRAEVNERLYRGDIDTPGFETARLALTDMQAYNMRTGECGAAVDWALRARGAIIVSFERMR